MPTASVPKVTSKEVFTWLKVQRYVRLVGNNRVGWCLGTCKRWDVAEEVGIHFGQVVLDCHNIRPISWSKYECPLKTRLSNSIIEKESARRLELFRIPQRYQRLEQQRVGINEHDLFKAGEKHAQHFDIKAPTIGVATLQISADRQLDGVQDALSAAERSHTLYTYSSRKCSRFVMSISLY